MRKKTARISRPKYRARNSHPKRRVLFQARNVASLASLQRTIDQVRFRRALKKANPREAHNQGRTKNCTTIVVLPSPRSLFSSIERRLDCRLPPAARQRNQSRLKQTITTPIQDESIRQPDADVNSLSTFTRPSAGSLEAIASNTFKNHLKSLIDLLLVPCRPLVDPLYVSYWF